MNTADGKSFVNADTKFDFEWINTSRILKEHKTVHCERYNTTTFGGVLSCVTFHTDRRRVI